jgi:hypothetical protein
LLTIEMFWSLKLKVWILLTIVSKLLILSYSYLYL